MRFSIFTFLAPIFLLLGLSCPVFVAATEVPRETLERLSQLAVEKAEIRHLNAMGKLTDPEYNARYKILSAEETVLWHLSAMTTILFRVTRNPEDWRKYPLPLRVLQSIPRRCRHMRNHGIEITHSDLRKVLF